MTKLAEKYLKLGAQETIIQDGYKGRLIDIQLLSDGYVTGIYRFPGGDCCPSEALVVKIV